MLFSKIFKAIFKGSKFLKMIKKNFTRNFVSETFIEHGSIYLFILEITLVGISAGNLTFENILFHNISS